MSRIARAVRVEIGPSKIRVDGNVSPRNGHEWNRRGSGDLRVTAGQYTSSWKDASCGKDAACWVESRRGIVRRIVWNASRCRSSGWSARQSAGRNAAGRRDFARSGHSVVIEQIVHRAEQEAKSLARHHGNAFVDCVTLAHTIQIRDRTILTF